MNDGIQREDFENLVALTAEAVKASLEFVRKNVEDGRTYIPTHEDFPSITRHSNGMPFISKYSQDQKNNYGAVLYRGGLSGIFIDGGRNPIESIEGVQSLVKWLSSNEIFRNYFSISLLGEETFSEHIVFSLIAGMVNRYAHRNNTLSFNYTKVLSVVAQMLDGVLPSSLRVSVVVPIALTPFDFKSMKLSDNTYIMSIPDRFHQARADAKYFGTSVHGHVLSAATHALVFRDYWLNDNSSYSNIAFLLANPRSFPTPKIDKFFAALRIVTGVETGYAQMLFAARRWKLHCLADLPSVYGATIRRYPASFDEFAWYSAPKVLVSKEDMIRTGSIFHKLLELDHGSIEIAAKRLNMCMLRDDVEDTIIDAVVGLEALLADGDGQAISYKLGMRLAALTKIAPEKLKNPQDILADIRDVYTRRSAIAHGNKRKRGNNTIPTEPSLSDPIKYKAISCLMFALHVLIENPQFLNPKKIDTELLLGLPSQDDVKTPNLPFTR